MKAIYVSLLAAAGVLSAGAVQAQDAEALAKQKNCLACHAVDKKVVGPSYKDVAKKVHCQG
jgi:cytochrome c